MAVDEMYMENLDEFVNDENKVVTFKWLSTNLKVHVNQAKQMLYAFVQQERNKKDNDKLNVTYFVAGTPKNKNGCVGHQCVVVPEENLDATKSTLSTVTSCHIYSVQKVKLKDPGTLYLADYDNTKEKILSCNKYSAISCTRAKARSKEELAKLGIKLAPSQTAETAKVNGSSAGTKPAANGTSSTKVKVEPKGSIANMFSSGAKKNAQEKSTDAKTKEDVKEKPKQTKGGKAGGMMSFFSKQTDKPKPAEEKAESKKEEPKLPAMIDEKKETKKEKKIEKKPETKKGRQSKGKKSTRVSDSDEEDKPDKKRRKRIRNDLFDSSSEEEMDILEESPVPSPVREPSPAPESPIPEKVPDSDEEVKVVEETNGSQKRRKRTRKLVPKTFMDDDGFMVTEKVWESDSTDASEAEEPKKKPSPVKEKPQANKKASPNKKSPQKGGGKNQMSLTSFFKKK